MAIITKKEQKFNKIIDSLKSYSDDAFVDKFIEMYPKDWNKIKARYNKHERMNKKRKEKTGKGHPMAAPRKYILVSSYQFRKNTLRRDSEC